MTIRQLTLSLTILVQLGTQRVLKSCPWAGCIKKWKPTLHMITNLTTNRLFVESRLFWLSRAFLLSRAFFVESRLFVESRFFVESRLFLS